MDDYGFIALDTEHLNAVRMEVEINTAVVDTITFVFFSEYGDAQLLDVHPHPVEQLLLHDTVVERMTLFEFIGQELTYLATIIISLTLFFNIIHFVWKKFNPSQLHISERWKHIIKKIKRITSITLWAFKQLFYNVFGGLFLFVITTLLLVIFIGEDTEPSESLQKPFTSMKSRTDLISQFILEHPLQRGTILIMDLTISITK
ncbi:MAG: hypothetical protein MZV63_57970 [Marinilabiliales bacterium]|nr:hypothetical protein [Marinilabiliales bacterium]